MNMNWYLLKYSICEILIKEKFICKSSVSLQEIKIFIFIYLFKKN